MLPIELSVPLGIGHPALATYEPLQMKLLQATGAQRGHTASS